MGSDLELRSHPIPLSAGKSAPFLAARARVNRRRGHLLAKSKNINPETMNEYLENAKSSKLKTANIQDTKSLTGRVALSGCDNI